MKKLLFSALGLCLSFAAFAQDDRMFFVYGQDGSLSRYYMEDVDSITYSKYDMDSVLRQEYVTQVVWTFSGPERFALTEIDSVAFRTPEPVYQPNVIRIDQDEYPNYLIRVEGLTVVFQAALPAALVPQEGQVLFAEFTDDYADGFAGVVETVETVEDELIVTCYQAKFDDVFEELTLVGDYYVEEENDGKQSAPRYRLVPAPRRALGIDLDKEFPYTFNKDFDFSKDSITLKGSINQGLKVGVVARLLLGQEPYLELRFTDSEDYSFDFQATYSAKYEWVKKIEGQKIIDFSAVIPNCPVLKIDFCIVPFVKPSFKANAELHLDFKSAGEYAFIYTKGQFQKQIKDRNSQFQMNANLSFHGIAYTGVGITVGVSTTGDFLSASAALNVGPTFNADLNIDFTDEDLHRTATGPYESMLSSNAGLNVKLEAELAVAYNLVIKKDKKSWEYPLTEWEIGRFYLVPEFTQPELKVLGNNVLIQSSITRNLLLPAKVGYRIFDKEEKVIATVYDTATYWLNKKFANQPLRLQVNGLASKAYSAYPIFAMATVAPVVASPNTDFDVTLAVKTLGTACGSSSSRVTANGSVSGLQEATDVEAGIIYTDSDNELMLLLGGGATYVTTKKNLNADSDFTVTIKDLTPNTVYQYRAFVKIGDSVTYGETYTFRTKAGSDVEDAVADLLCLGSIDERVVFFYKPDAWNNLYLHIGSAGEEGTDLQATEVGDGYYRAVIPADIDLTEECLRMYWHDGLKRADGSRQTQPEQVQLQHLYYITHEEPWKQDNAQFVAACDVLRVKMICDVCE